MEYSLSQRCEMESTGQLYTFGKPYKFQNKIDEHINGPFDASECDDSAITELACRTHAREGGEE